MPIRKQNHRRSLPVAEETREQAAMRITAALKFIQREAGAAGMSTVSKHVGRAVKSAGEWSKGL